MSQAAAYIEPALLNVKDLNYDSWQTIYFQRTTVIVTELVLVYALHLYCITSLRVLNMLTIVQLRQDIQVEGHRTCSCTLDSTIAWPPDH